MDTPKGLQVNDNIKDRYSLKIIKNIYVQVQVGKVWKDFLKYKLETITFKQSQYDEYVFMKVTILYILQYCEDSELKSTRF